MEYTELDPKPSVNTWANKKYLEIYPLVRFGEFEPFGFGKNIQNRFNSFRYMIYSIMSLRHHNIIYRLDNIPIG